MRLRVRKACAWAGSAVLGAAMIGWSMDMKTALGQEAGGSLVAGLRANGAEVKPLGRRGELEGWLVTPRGQRPYTLYVDGSGYGVMGLLFSPDGSEVTGRQIAGFREGAAAAGAERGEQGQGRNPGAPGLEASGVRAATEGRRAESDTRPGDAYRALLADVRQAPSEGASPVSGGRGPSSPASLAGIFEMALAVEGFDLGGTGPQVAIFADPSCMPSRAAVAELARRALAGGIRLRVVPVGARGAEAEVMAVLVLGSEDRARGWFTLDREEEWPALGADAASGVALNRRLFERTGSEFVPYSLMRGADGKVRAAVGADFGDWFGEGAAQ